MTSYLIDVNVWVALTWGLHTHHESAKHWNEKRLDARLLFCRFTMLGLLRLLTTKALMAESTLSLTEALQVYDEWLDDPRVEFLHEPRGVNRTFRKALGHFGQQQAPKTIADCYIAALAESADAHLVTFDRALASFGKRHNVDVELLKPE